MAPASGGHQSASGQQVMIPVNQQMLMMPNSLSQIYQKNSGNPDAFAGKLTIE